MGRAHHRMIKSGHCINLGRKFRRRSHIGRVCRARAPHHRSFAGRTSTRAISWSIALASPVIPPGKSMACRSRRVTVPSVNRWRARQWSRVPPSGRRRVREILRSASITRLADRSQLLREPAHRPTRIQDRPQVGGRLVVAGLAPYEQAQPADIGGSIHQRHPLPQRFRCTKWAAASSRAYERRGGCE